MSTDLAREDAPGARTLLGFSRLLERHRLTRCQRHLSRTQERVLREGTIVDATLIAARPSTKNRKRARDPEMHQTKKGNQYQFGMEAQVGPMPQPEVLLRGLPQLPYRCGSTPSEFDIELYGVDALFGALHGLVRDSVRTLTL